MRPLEMAGFLGTVLSLLAMLAMLPLSMGIAAAAISCGILVAAAVLLGAYWQLIPLYLAALLTLLTLYWMKRKLARKTRIVLASAVACLLAMTAVFTYLLPMFVLPQPTGKYAVGTQIVHLVDPIRKETHVAGPPRPREIMVQLWYPATTNGQHLASYRRRRETTLLSSYMDALWTNSYRNAPVATQGAPFPVLLFNPAWTGQRTQNTYQMEDLASHGFIVAGIDHPYNSGPIAFPDGRVLGIAGMHDISDFRHTTVAQQMAIGYKEVMIEAGDDALVLNSLSAADLNPASAWYRRVDANDAGAFGHSFGGAVAAQICYEDPRVKAAINEDGWMFGDVVTHGLDKPYLVMSDDDGPPSPAELKSTDVQTSREAELNESDDNNLKRTMQQFGGYKLTILGAKHEDFTDRSLYSPIRRLTETGTIAPQQAHDIVEAYTLQFFEHYLQGKPATLFATTRSPYKEVQFENWFAKNASTH